jgi:hypothetical protein
MPLPSEAVRRPEEWTEYRAPGPPAEMPNPLFETLSLTPGTSLIDFRIRNPIPIYLFSQAIPSLSRSRALFCR